MKKSTIVTIILIAAAVVLGVIFISWYLRKATPLYIQGTVECTTGEFYQFNLSSCIRQQNSLTAQFVSFSFSNLANIFYTPQFLQ